MLLVALAVALAGCGASSAESTGANGSGNQNEVTKLTVGVTPVGDFAPIYYADKKGIFAKHGLQVKIDPKGSSEVPPLVSNSYQAVTMSWTTFIQAVAKGIPLEGVFPGIDGAPNTQTGIYVMKSSGLTKPAQLEGKSVGINQPKATGELNSRVALAEQGVNVSKVNFKVLPLSTLGNAMVAGKVDATYLFPPFSTKVQAKGAKLLVDAYKGKLNGAPVAGYVMTKSFVKAHPKTVQNFVASLTQAAQALDKPGAYRNFVPRFTSLTPKLAQQIPVYTFHTSINVPKLQQEADLMAQKKFAAKKIDIANHVLRPKQ
jgi:NitT/TauT family transport system substrate-binding protein